MKPFAYESKRVRVVFGSGSLDLLPAEIEKLGAERVMLVSTPGRHDLAARVSSLLSKRVVQEFGRAEVHVPGEVARAARDAAHAAQVDCIVALGGGSAIGVAKSVALVSDVKLVAVPTTYSGSEMTPVWGMTDAGEKTTGRNARVQPRLVVYDPALTLDLPVAVSSSSGLNAIAHCVEALYAVDSNPLTSLIAQEGVRALSRALPEINAEASNLSAREAALYGAWLAGTALSTVPMAFHHKICHVLGGSFGLPHAETHAVMLPYTSAFNRAAAEDAMRTVAIALGASDAPSALLALARRLGIPGSLREIGLAERGLERVADLAVENQYPNPRELKREYVLDLLRAAYDGNEGYIQAAAS